MRTELSQAAQLAGGVILFSICITQPNNGVIQVIWLLYPGDKPSPGGSDWRSLQEQKAIKVNLMSVESLEQVMSEMRSYISSHHTGSFTSSAGAYGAIGPMISTVQPL
jgi:hypothetical protein